MPGPYLRNPVPYWLRPENASVLDSPLTKAARTIASLTGINDPQSQVLGLLNPLVPEAGASVQALEGLGAKAIKAYHGSPHDFERFSVSKIGTGEGGQAYGHGLYFAEREGTAQSYREGLSAPEIVANGQKLPVQSESEHVAAAHLDNAVSSQSSAPYQHAGNTIRRLAASAEGDAKRRYTEALDVLADWGGKGATVGPKGHMYEVAIHADPEHLLDWDKPFGQQPPKVKEQLRKALPWMERADPERLSNAPVRAILDQSDLGSPALTSSALRDAGIPGIKYLDAGSRTAGEGSRNFVIFDDSLVSVLKKYGVALPIIEGMRQKAQANGWRVAAADVNGAINQ